MTGPRRIAAFVWLLLLAACGSSSSPGVTRGEGGSMADDAMAGEAMPDDVASVPPASCSSSGAAGAGCGPANEDCCASDGVPTGTYPRTYTNTGAGPTGEANPATVTGLRIDRYLVTVGRFREFVQALRGADGGSGWSPPSGSGKHTHLSGGKGLNATGGGYEPGWVATDDANLAPTDANLSCQASFSTWTPAPAAGEGLPINCVNWYEAFAFCIWDGGFLPSEAEWEYAAAGGGQERPFPWGAPAPGTASAFAIYGCDYPSGSGTCAGIENIAPVGTAPAGAGLWGQMDLAGEVSEWTVDQDAPYVDPCVDCANVDAGGSRVIRGGDFSHPQSYLTPPYRFGVAPTLRDDDVGFRCARAP